MSEIEAFQKEHGAQWAGIIQTDAYVAGGTIVLNKELNELRTLSADEIAKNGVVILARFCGVLRHESALFGLPVEKDFKFGGAPAEDYPDAEREFIEQKEHQEPIPVPTPQPARKSRSKRR